MSKGEVFAVVSGKGGVGKTTTVSNISLSIAQLGKKVCIIDADLGLSKLDLVMGAEDSVMYNVIDVAKGECSLKEALIRDKRSDNLYLLSASQSKGSDVLADKDMVRILNELRKNFDYIFIDCPAGIREGFKNSIVGADKAIIVVNPETSSLRDADRVIGILEINGFDSRNKIGLLITRYRHKMSKKNEMIPIEDIKSLLGISLMGVIPEDERVIISSNRGMPIILDKKSKAGRHYNILARRLTGENVSDEFLQEEGIIDKFINMLSGNKSKNKKYA